MLIDPPRDGAVELIKAFADDTPRRIVYISCNPATLARDVSRLAGWRVHALACYDMFPQTAHVETVCELVPEET